MNISFLWIMPKNANNASLLHIPVLVKSNKRILPLCSNFYGDSGDMRTNFSKFEFDHFMAFWKIQFSKNKNLKLLAAEFLEFALKFCLNTEKYQSIGH